MTELLSVTYQTSFLRGEKPKKKNDRPSFLISFIDDDESQKCYEILLTGSFRKNPSRILIDKSTFPFLNRESCQLLSEKMRDSIPNKYAVNLLDNIDFGQALRNIVHKVLCQNLPININSPWHWRQQINQILEEIPILYAFEEEISRISNLHWLLARNDAYHVLTGNSRFSESSLSPYQIYVLKNSGRWFLDLICEYGNPVEKKRASTIINTLLRINHFANEDSQGASA